MYQALYRKWRPQTFDDVIAQPHIVTTLKNQLQNDKTSHAYLFTGSRGTGKTSCARILAKAINCLNPKGANPCLECENCIDADNSALADIVEIDAASNNSVDDVRDLRNSTAYAPERCKFKVFIIDEVHMLSISAFNALLKIMEEPPVYVKFILATTEVHKVPITILSRCQRYDFRRILPADIAARLEFVATQEKFQITNDAALLIATLADGGMRDALSLLDGCTAVSDNITAETVSSVAGAGTRKELFDIINAVITQNTAEAIAVVTALYNASKDITRLCEELIFQFRNIMLLQTDPATPLLTAVLPDEVLQLQNISKSITIHNTLYYLECLQKCSENLSRVPNKRVELEMCIVSLCNGMGIGVQTSQTVNIPQPMQTPQIVSIPQPMQNPQVVNVPQQAQVSPVQSVVSPGINIGEFVAEWEDILSAYKSKDHGGYGLLVGSKGKYSKYNDEIIIIVMVGSSMVKDYFNPEERKLKLKQSISQVLGKEYKLVIKISENSVNAQTILNRANAQNLNIEVENS
ncbi:MAG: DNA polymerase III subunit gamma/tau [Oscillospiraceae bacterium]|jgi:DNA polymerase-3 subunit gamma/tau|nr:DNA polymerase III subunit gamma/tau [Oscillospiraceae bacterium]